VPVLPVSASDDAITCVPSASRGVVRRGRQIEIDDEREPARLGRARDRGDEFRKAVVDQNSIGLRNQSGGIARQDAVEPMAAPRRNGFFAAGVEQNERDRRAGASHALDARAIGAFGRKAGLSPMSTSMKPCMTDR